MGQGAPLLRCGTVWLLVTFAVAALVAWLAGDLLRAGELVATGRLATVGFTELLVLVSTIATVACALWFWLVTSAVALEAARGEAPESWRRSGLGCPPGLRRLLYGACGLALAAGLGSPTLAAADQRHPPGEAALLAGLPLPDRAVAAPPLRQAAPPAPSPHHVAAPVAVGAPGQRVQVRPGDTLWRLAAASLGPGAATHEVVRAWRAIYHHNRAVIGPDPDLILPGTTLSIPTPQEETP